MKALVYLGPKQLEIRQLPDAEPGPDEVKIKVKYTGICGSDLHGYLGTTGRRTPPMVMGHEFSGTVFSVGKNVSRFKKGDRVTAQPILNCGHCSYCQAGDINICPSRKFLGTFSTNGTLGEYIILSQENVLPLPEEVSYKAGALIEPTAVAYSAVKMAGNVEGKTVMVIGAGTIGLLVMMVAKYYKAKTIIATDLSPHRLQIAKECGADVALNPAAQDIEKELQNLGLRDEVDITIECVGATPTVQQSLRFLRNKGTAVWVGNSAPMVEINMQDVVTRELTIKGTYIYNQQDFIDSIALLGQKEMKQAENLVDEIVPLEQAADMFEQLLAKDTKLIKVLVEP